MADIEAGVPHYSSRYQTYATSLCDRSVFQLVGVGIRHYATGEGVFLYTNNWPRERLVASAQRFRKSELLEMLAPEPEVVQVGGFSPSTSTLC